jgi:ATP-dependent exoDNAse (exonuclease V) beta subunit
MRTWNDEEKRVCYVACTRARNKLIIMNIPKRGKRSECSMYDDVGPTINFTKIKEKAKNASKIDTTDLKTGYFPNFPSAGEIRMQQMFSQLDRELKNKYVDYFNDEDTCGSLLPTFEDLEECWRDIWR